MRGKPGTSAAWPYVLFALLAGTAVITLVPVVWMLLTAFKTGAEVNADPPTWLPHTFRWANFRDAWEFAPFGRYLVNSLVMAGGIALLQLVTSALAAYAFARLHFRGREALFYLYLGTLIISPQVTVIPQFLIVRELHWVDTYQGLIVPQAFTAFGVSTGSPSTQSATIEALTRVVALEPLHEDARARLIQLDGLAGRRHLAVAHYQRFRALLKGELGADPLPRTTEIYRSVVAGRICPEA